MSNERIKLPNSYKTSSFGYNAFNVSKYIIILSSFCIPSDKCHKTFSYFSSHNFFLRENEENAVLFCCHLGGKKSSKNMVNESSLCFLIFCIFYFLTQNSIHPIFPISRFSKTCKICSFFCLFKIQNSFCIKISLRPLIIRPDRQYFIGLG